MQISIKRAHKVRSQIQQSIYLWRLSF